MAKALPANAANISFDTMFPIMGFDEGNFDDDT